MMSSSDSQNLELISLIWLDNMADATQENRDIQDKLRSIVNYLRTFDNCQQCQHYIQHQINDKHEKIILIASGRLGQEIVEHIHDLKQIISIFVYCFDKDRNELWAKQYKKIRGVIVDLNDLLRLIELDCKSDEQKFNETIQLYRNKDEIISLILQIDASLIDKKTLLNICSKEYQNNISELEKIREFQHLYSPLNALDWFFNETFLYRLLIKALHLFNIEIIFILRFFIQDIDEQLKTCSTVSEHVYKGQLMTMDQINFIKESIKEKFIRFNSFIIAQKNQEKILKSLQNSSNADCGLHRVLFDIDSNQIGKQYKEHIIFPITTYFNIISIEYNQNIWIIKIIVNNSNDNIKKKAKTPFELAHHLRHIGQFDQAEKLFKLFLNQYPILNSQSYNGLGRIAQDKGLYKSSLNFYLKSLETVSFKNRPFILNNIGCAYDYLEQYENALQYYSQSLTLMNNNDINESMCLSNIGITYAKNEQYQQAIECFQQSLDIRKKLLPKNHSHIGISYTNLAFVLSLIGDFDIALQYYNLAVQLFISNNLYIFQAIVYQNMAKIFQEKNQFKQALNYYQNAENIFRQFRSLNHPNLVYIQQQINQLKQQNEIFI